jgi:RNA polymerase sigma-70 factor (ECF subfamily)
MTEPRSQQAPSRASLIAQAKSGDERAFSLLLQPIRARLFTFILRQVAGRSEAEEILQDVYFKIWQGLTEYADRGRVESWVFTIAYRQVASHHRTRARDLAASELDHTIASPFTPDDDYSAREKFRGLAKAIRALPEAQRQVFLLRTYGPLTFADIAELTGTPLGTILSRMHDATNAIKRVLKDDD